MVTAMPTTDSDTFDPRTHRLVAQRWFDDFRIGERFALPSRTMTEAIFLAFQAASGDNHPIHYDIEYCRARGLPNMLAHGFLVAIQTVAGAGLFAHMVSDSLKAFLEQSTRFLQPVFVGDTLYPALEVNELSPNRTTGVVGLRGTVHNQHGALVLDGQHRYLLRRSADRITTRAE
jgi:acyl dehydratase